MRGERGAASALADALSELGYGELIQAPEPTAAGSYRQTWRDVARKTRTSAGLHFTGGIPMVAAVSLDDLDEVGDLQQKFWNFGRVPLLFAEVDGMLHGYTGMRKPARSADGHDTLLGAGTPALYRYSRYAMESGRGLAHLASIFKKGEQVDQVLLKNLRAFRQRYTQLSGGAVEAILGGSLLVKYMEDRRILSADHLDELCGYERLDDVLNDGVRPTARLFEALAERFNGDVFGGMGRHLRELPTAVTQDVASLLNGDELETGQRALWPYDFAAIPTVLVSAIYEELLSDVKQQNAAHYTPVWLIDLILDELLPWNERGKPLIVDPACGSGAFLAAAYNRLLARLEADTGGPPTFDDSIQMLRECIFGFEIDASATAITVFGLYLTLLERQDPPTIWREGRLPNLSGSNVLTIDAFDPRTAQFDGTADIIVGNPPWKSKLSPTVNDWLDSNKYIVGDQQLAQAFMWRSHSLLRDGGKMGLVLPTNIFHGDRAARFRDDFNAKVGDRLTVDLTALRRRLFSTAAMPATILCTSKGHATESQHTEILAPPHPGNKALDGIILAPSDIATMDAGPQTRPNIDSDIIATMATHPKLKSFRFIVGRGFQIRGGDEYDPGILSTIPFVARSSIHSFNIDEFGPPIDTVLHRTRNPAQYRGPLILVGRSIHYLNGIQAALVDSDAGFDDTVIGIAGGPKDDNLRLAILGYLNSSVCLYWHLTTASALVRGRPVISPVEHTNFPIAPPSPALTREVRRLNRQGGHLLDRARLNDIVFDCYGINTPQRLHINDAVATFLRSESDNRLEFREPSGAALTDYVFRLRTVLLEVIGDVFPHTEVTLVPDIIASHVTVRIDLIQQSTPPDVAQLRYEFDRASAPAADLSRVLAQRSAILVHGARIHIIKPNELRLWKLSCADADAASIIEAVLSVADDADVT
ncbi:N-6 DNA methylase [Mycolicibacterium sp. lyk4-40-TYG-92]|uniref:N-6 DNA methylase n=1 Tax=Mycolicibacterium sp. lyk4-40-TYG-92 TaxID=3040295 RepID=UPI00254B451E|nr:N-6 DNA methylase [Mycolicibacterium sp. lyk4-40-TYG-92]